MVVCPNCGTGNELGSRFCEECGADLRALGSAPPPPLPLAPSPAPTAPGIPSNWGAPVELHPEPPRGRRVWLWISVGVILACVVCCLVPLILISTVGEDEFYDFATRVSRELTEVAPTPTRESR